MQKYKAVFGTTPNWSKRCQIEFSISTPRFFLGLKQKDTPIAPCQLSKSTEQNSRSPKTITLYSLNNRNTCCRARVCSEQLLFPNLGNKHQYNGIALFFQIRASVKRLIHPH